MAVRSAVCAQPRLACHVAPATGEAQYSPCSSWRVAWACKVFGQLGRWLCLWWWRLRCRVAVYTLDSTIRPVYIVGVASKAARLDVWSGRTRAGHAHGSDTRAREHNVINCEPKPRAAGPGSCQVPFQVCWWWPGARGRGGAASRAKQPGAGARAQDERRPGGWVAACWRSDAGARAGGT